VDSLYELSGAVLNVYDSKPAIKINETVDGHHTVLRPAHRYHGYLRNELPLHAGTELDSLISAVVRHYGGSQLWDLSDIEKGKVAVRKRGPNGQFMQQSVILPAIIGLIAGAALFILGEKEPHRRRHPIAVDVR